MLGTLPPILGWLVAILVMLALFGACIFVHELGHFWMARRCGMKVERFSIGFGSALWSRKHDGVEYRISVVPLGGYVMLPQMNPADGIEGKSELPAEELPPVAPWRKILVALAGPAMNVVFGAAIALVISIHGIESEDAPERLVVTQVLADSPEYAAGLCVGDQIVSVDGSNVSRLSDPYEFLLMSTREEVPFVIRRDGQLHAMKIHFDRDKVENVREPKFELGESSFIRRLEADAPAEKAGLSVGDRIISVNGKPALNMYQLVKLIGRYQGEPVQIDYLRNGAKHQTMVTPFYDKSRQRGRIGVEIGFDPNLPKVIVHPGVTEQLTRPLQSVTRMLAALFSPGVTGVTPNKLGGAPMIMYTLTQRIKESLLYGLDWTVFLNVNLAILNLLPIPVLDGGHILLAIAEWIRRRPLNARFIRVVWTTCAVVLISFMVFISLKDIWLLTKYRLFPQPALTETNAPPVTAAPPAK